MRFNWRNLFVFIFCLAISSLMLSPSWREMLKKQFKPEERKVLATLEYKSEGSKYRVIKLRHGDQIVVEIYKAAGEGGANELHSVFEIPDSMDVFYDFKSSLSNLFEANIDHDEDHEIIVPIMDRNLVSHLNVIKYNADNHTFSYHASEKN